MADPYLGNVRPIQTQDAVGSDQASGGRPLFSWQEGGSGSALPTSGGVLPLTRHAFALAIDGPQRDAREQGLFCDETGQNSRRRISGVRRAR